MKLEFPTFRAIGRVVFDGSRYKAIGRIVFDGSRYRTIGRVALRRLRKTLTVMIPIIIVLLIVHSILLVVWGRQLERKLAEVRQRGEPVFIADLIPKPIPDNENAAVIYARVFSIIDGQAGQYGRGRDFEDAIYTDYIAESTTPEARAALAPKVRQALREEAAAFPLIAEAVSHPQCEFPVNWEAGGNALFPHWSKMRKVSQLIAARIVIEAEDGNMDAAIDTAITGLRVSRALEDKPLLISFLVRSGIIQKVLGGLKMAIESKNLTTEQAYRLYGELGNISSNQSFHKALSSERPFTNWGFDQARSNSDLLYLFYNDKNRFWLDWIGKHGYGLLAYVWRPLSYKDQIVSTTYWDSQMKLADLPYRESRRFLHWPDSTDIPKYAIVTKALLPVYQSCMAQRDITQAKIGMAQIAIALKAYKSKYGSYPVSLEEAKMKPGWKLPDDPFTGKPFVYNRKGEGFTVYSLGADLLDDGGKTDKELYGPGTSDKGDIVWVWKQ